MDSNTKQLLIQELKRLISEKENELKRLMKKLKTTLEKLNEIKLKIN